MLFERIYKANISLTCVLETIIRLMKTGLIALIKLAKDEEMATRDYEYHPSITETF